MEKYLLDINPIEFALWCADSLTVIPKKNINNARLGEKFLNAHSNANSFVDAIRSETEYFSNHGDRIRKGIKHIYLNDHSFERPSVVREFETFM
ncbi:hypothetical protein HZS_1979 [Henneguya salminicola]|nr:hypothetical protein HZS_1979 [Henneguya salminicola]